MKPLEEVEPMTDGGGIETMWRNSWVWGKGKDAWAAENRKRAADLEIGKKTVGGVGIFQEHSDGMFCGMEANVKRDTVKKGLVDQSVVEDFTLC